MTPSYYHEPFVREAILLASQARSDGNEPFGALLVLDGKVVLTAMNSVNTDCDPTAHAETNLVTHAIRQLTPKQIRRSILYTSCKVLRNVCREDVLGGNPIRGLCTFVR